MSAALGDYEARPDYEARLRDARERATPHQRRMIAAMIEALARGRLQVAALCAEVLANSMGQVGRPCLSRGLSPGDGALQRD